MQNCISLKSFALKATPKNTMKKCPRITKQEANDIFHHLVPALEAAGVPLAKCKIDTTITVSERFRGDVWISKSDQSTSGFKKRLVTLIEAKHKKCEIGDIEWRDAMEQGRRKATLAGLSFYIVTNCIDAFRFYNRYTDEELTLDGKFLTGLVALPVLEKISSQINEYNSSAFDRARFKIVAVSEAVFRRSLEVLKDVYRSCGLKNGDERIDPTVAFVILKYIGEQETEVRTLDAVVRTWSDYGKGRGNFKADFEQSRNDIFGGEYGSSYRDFADLVTFPAQLKNEHYEQIYRELNSYHLHGCNFDVFGAIYEAFASQQKKKEFGEFYTRRHITGVIARLLLREETASRPLKICDPACGTAGFLTEAYKTLRINYSSAGRWNQKVSRELEENTFFGFDNQEKSVARARLNMFLVGDGHTHIHKVDDSLTQWHPEMRWQERAYDYILTNPPMGLYGGDASVTEFRYTNERRYELLFAERVIDATVSGGQIAIIVPDGMLEAPSRENFRRKVLENCDINAIISLTRFAFAPYTKEKTYVLFLQRKQEEMVGTFQERPIWNFIVDFDGFANSDKRYRTKWHDDLPLLEQKFDGALKCAKLSSVSPKEFLLKRSQFEAEVSSGEQTDGLTGKKYGYVPISAINSENFHNLLSEFHLRPHVIRTLSEAEYSQEQDKILRLLRDLISRQVIDG